MTELGWPIWLAKLFPVMRKSPHTSQTIAIVSVIRGEAHEIDVDKKRRKKITAYDIKTALPPEYALRQSRARILQVPNNMIYCRIRTINRLVCNWDLQKFLWGETARIGCMECLLYLASSSKCWSWCHLRLRASSPNGTCFRLWEGLIC